jgi:type I restriction enzyme S subunit
MSSNEWKKYKLGDLGKLARGKSKNRPRDAAFLYGGIYPFIQTGDIKSANHKIYKYSQTYSEAGLAQSKLWSEGTIAITIAANIADTGILTFPACFPDSVLGFVADKEKCDVDFAEYLLQFYKKKIQSHAVGSVQDNINLGTFENIEFDIPPLPTQHRIADILSALDEKIELNRQVNVTLEAMAQAIFREWFVDFNLPDVPDPKGLSRDHASLQAKESGENGSRQAGETFRVSGIPQGWRVGKLGEICEFAYGKGLKSENRTEGEFPVVGSNGIVGTHNEYLVEGPGIVIGRKGTIGEVIWLHQNFFPIDTTFYINDLLGVNALYFHYFLLKEQDFKKIGSDSAVPGLNRNQAYDNLVVIPSTDAIKQFNEKMVAIFEQIKNNEQQTATLAALRDALLPKLMSGEIGV